MPGGKLIGMLRDKGFAGSKSMHSDIHAPQPSSGAMAGICSRSTCRGLASMLKHWNTLWRSFSISSASGRPKCSLNSGSLHPGTSGLPHANAMLGDQGLAEVAWRQAAAGAPQMAQHAVHWDVAGEPTSKLHSTLDNEQNRALIASWGDWGAHNMYA